MLGINPDRFNFVYVGNSQWRKGLDILINVWHKCFKKYDKCSLIIKDNPDVYGKNNILNEVIKMQYKTESAEVLYCIFIKNIIFSANIQDYLLL